MLNYIIDYDIKHTTWWCITMMTSSNGSIFRVTGPLCGEFTGLGEFPTQRPVTRCFDVFCDLRLNKRLSKQPRGWWFEPSSWSLWRQCNARRKKEVYTVVYNLPLQCLTASPSFFDATYMCGPHIAQVRIRIALRIFRSVVILAIQAILPLRYKYMKNVECHP